MNAIKITNSKKSNGTSCKLALSVFMCLFFFCCIFNLFSQNCGIAEKEIINGMELYKVYSQNTKEGIRLTADNVENLDGSTCYYFDNDGNVRKFISWFEYPESSHVIIAYYNEEGKLMYILFSEFQPEGYSYQGVAHKTYCGEFRDSIDSKYKVQYNMMIDFESSNVQGTSSKYPSVIGEWRLSNYTHIDSLKSYLQIETLQLPPDCKKVQFNKPSKRQTTFTNNYNINLREAANLSSKVITTIDIGERITVLDVLQEESIKNTGNYNWYKIKKNDMEGYVFGAFLEPVEKEIK